MSLPSILAAPGAAQAAAASRAAPGQGSHRFWMSVAVGISCLISLGLAVYGMDYYPLGPAGRALSPKHELLKPSGEIGVRLGLFGVALFLLLYLYAIRKHWKWLSRQGNSRHWLDFHVLLGIFAPLVITFHSAFKFRGIAGIAYWIMVAVALSGFVGRYLYAQIPRSLGEATLTMNELRGQLDRLSHELSAQKVLTAADLAPVLRMPTQAQVESLSLMAALWMAFKYDLGRPWRLRALRAKARRSTKQQSVACAGMFQSTGVDVEHVITCVKEQASLTKKTLLLTKSQEMFQLWHVIHRPFSYSFAILASIHAAVEVTLGYW